MRKIEAYVKARRVHEVLELLHEIEGLTGMSTFGVHGFGRGRDMGSAAHITDTTQKSEAHAKVEVVCRDELVEQVIASIQKGAHTGLRADGKIYLYQVEDAVRISTGERGEAAV
jgi:nitrogen regulatory protein PII